MNYLKMDKIILKIRESKRKHPYKVYLDSDTISDINKLKDITNKNTSAIVREAVYFFKVYRNKFEQS